MSQAMIDKVTKYWNDNLHDMAVVRHPEGSREFFEDLGEYHFDKQRHLAKILDYRSYKGKKLLDLGCGVGVDLVRFAQEGVESTGVDISERAIGLARKNFEYQMLSADLRVMDGEHLDYEDNTFDAVYAHGILPYTMDAQRLVNEIHRILKPGGEVIIQAYHRNSWMYLLRKLMKVRLEHEGAPVFRVHTVREVKDLTQSFKKVQIIYERFPVKTRLHGGLKGVLYNTLFVGAFNAIPRPLVRRFGWHIVVKAVK